MAEISCDAQTLANAAKCFCGLSMRQLAEIQVELLCEILNAGGAGGQSCLLCGTTDPTDAPVCDCAIYYNRTTCLWWFWDSDVAQWKLFIK